MLPVLHLKIFSKKFWISFVVCEIFFQFAVSCRFLILILSGKNGTKKFDNGWTISRILSNQFAPLAIIRSNIFSLNTLSQHFYRTLCECVGVFLLIIHSLLNFSLHSLACYPAPVSFMHNVLVWTMRFNLFLICFCVFIASRRASGRRVEAWAKRGELKRCSLKKWTRDGKFQIWNGAESGTWVNQSKLNGN